MVLQDVSYIGCVFGGWTDRQPDYIAVLKFVDGRLSISQLVADNYFEPAMFQRFNAIKNNECEDHKIITAIDSPITFPIEYQKCLIQRENFIPPPAMKRGSNNPFLYRRTDIDNFEWLKSMKVRIPQRSAVVGDLGNPASRSSVFYYNYLNQYPDSNHIGHLSRAEFCAASDIIFELDSNSIKNQRKSGQVVNDLYDAYKDANPSTPKLTAPRRQSIRAALLAHYTHQAICNPSSDPDIIIHLPKSLQNKDSDATKSDLEGEDSMIAPGWYVIPDRDHSKHGIPRNPFSEGPDCIVGAGVKRKGGF